MGQHHRKSDPSSELFENPIELENRILQILYLSNGEDLSSKKIVHLLPEKHISRQLVDLLLSNLSKRGLVEVQKVQTLCTIFSTREWIKVQRTHLQNPNADNTVHIQRNEFGKPNMMNLTHMVYCITEKGIQIVQNNNQLNNL